ncbi:Phosphate-binding DING protein (related to PstS) [plant metagenome]|uniref:Phosphate-binding DING protein (Related to PstS) n=1 Tax=plant metagenome TaxID=1297885 RepID=A0A484TRN2_9ZZZZ
MNAFNLKKSVAAVVLAGLSMVGAAASAQDVIGGGATLPQGLYNSLFPNLTDDFAYTGVGSGAGRRAILNNDSDEFKVGGVPVYSPKVRVDFSGSDAALRESELDTYNTRYNNGAASTIADFGPIIQVPAVVTSVTLPYRHATINNLNLTDAQICGIYAGTITNWSQIVTGAAGTIDVVYRTEGSGTTELLAKFLDAQCSQNFQVSDSFATVVANVGGVRANWIGVTGSGGVASTTLAANNRIGYVSPDYVNVDSNTNVARVRGALPSVQNVKNMLVVTPAAPATTAYGNPLAWSPNFTYPPIPNAYPILGFTNLLVGQCYDDAAGESVAEFLTTIYGSDDIVEDHDFVPLSPAWKNAATAAFLTASSDLAIGNATECAGKGRTQP